MYNMGVAYPGPFVKNTKLSQNSHQGEEEDDGDGDEEQRVGG